MGLDTKYLPENILSKISKKDLAPLGKAGRTAAECQEVYLAGEELRLQKDIANYLKHVQPPVYVHQAPMRKKAQGKPGRADFIVCVQGRWLSLEAKSSVGKQSDEQRVHQAEIGAAGGIYWICRSLFDVKYILTMIKEDRI